GADLAEGQRRRGFALARIGRGTVHSDRVRGTVRGYVVAHEPEQAAPSRLQVGRRPRHRTRNAGAGHQQDERRGEQPARGRPHYRGAAEEDGSPLPARCRRTGCRVDGQATPPGATTRRAGKGAAAPSSRSRATRTCRAVSSWERWEARSLSRAWPAATSARI